MKTIIIDDEIHALESLEYDLKEYCPEVQLIGKASSPEEGIALIDGLKPDLVMTDVQMPRMNAFTMIDSLTHRDFDLILVTAFNQYAVRAFEFSAIDYLVKPTDPAKLKQAIARVIDRKQNHDIEEKLSLIMHNLKFGNDDNFTLAIPTSEGAEFVDVKEIVRLEADSNYCTIYFENSKKLVVSKPLKHFADILTGHKFLRIHQSYLINSAFIKSYRKGATGSIVLKDGTNLPISRSCKSNVTEFLFGM